MAPSSPTSSSASSSLGSASSSLESSPTDSLYEPGIVRERRDDIWSTYEDSFLPLCNDHLHSRLCPLLFHHLRPIILRRSLNHCVAANTLWPSRCLPKSEVGDGGKVTWVTDWKQLHRWIGTMWAEIRSLVTKGWTLGRSMAQMTLSSPASHQARQRVLLKEIRLVEGLDDDPDGCSSRLF